MLQKFHFGVPPQNFVKTTVFLLEQKKPGETTRFHRNGVSSVTHPHPCSMRSIGAPAKRAAIKARFSSWSRSEITNGMDTYCWWLKSCTTWDVWNLINNGINYISTGAGFQPSTVWNPIYYSLKLTAKIAPENGWLEGRWSDGLEDDRFLSFWVSA